MTAAKEFAEKEPQTSSQTAEPLRIEFFGDTIESIREINLDTQLSTRQIKTIDIVSALSPTAETSKELFLNLLPAETIVILEEPNDCEEVAKVFLERSENPSRLYTWSDLYNAISKFTQLFIYRFAPMAGEDVFKVNVKSVQQFQQAGLDRMGRPQGSARTISHAGKTGNKCNSLLRQQPPKSTASRKS